MSTYEDAELACPACGRDAKHQVAVSVNAVRRKTLRGEILDGSFQRFDCPACATSFHVETTFTYLDLERKQLILTMPATEQGRWSDAEATVRGIAERTLTGAGAPEAARALAEGLQLRVCFGLAAFAEKVRCAALEVDDVALELLKLSLVARDPRLAMTPLRLVGGNTTKLVLRGSTELEIDRAVLAEVDDPSRAKLRERLAEGPFVDVERLMV